MEAVVTIWYIVLFVIFVYLMSRVAHHFNNYKKKLDEMDKKIDKIMEIISKEES